MYDCKTCMGGWEIKHLNDNQLQANLQCICPPSYMVKENWQLNTTTLIIKVRNVDYGLTMVNEKLYDMPASEAWFFFRKHFKEAIMLDKRVLEIIRIIVTENFPPDVYTNNYISNTIHPSDVTGKWYDKYENYKKYETYEPDLPEGGRRPEVDKLPGLKAVVKYPGKFPVNNYSTGKKVFTMPLESAIIRLNDNDKWTREQIADWLETLDVDITFRSADAN